jgi:isoquinoline 1-oxidoreductase beta subunit
VREEPPGIVTAYWRGVGPTHNVFVIESFMDELAVAAGRDPVAYRRALLGNSPRAARVLEVAAERAGWGGKLPPREGRGVSLTHVFDSYLALIAEVAVSERGEIRMKRAVAALDCGVVVHPDNAMAQIEGGVLFGFTAALFAEITLKDGRVEQSNFHDYRTLRMNEAPHVEVHLVPSGERPGGIGETGTVGAAPALANAVFAATGTRVRRLPIRLSPKTT